MPFFSPFRSTIKLDADIVLPAPAPPKSSSSTTPSAAHLQTKPQPTPPKPSAAPSNASTSTNLTKPVPSASSTTSPMKPSAFSRAVIRSSTFGVPSRRFVKTHSESPRLRRCQMTTFYPSRWFIRIVWGRLVRFVRIRIIAGFTCGSRHRRRHC